MQCCATEITSDLFGRCFYGDSFATLVTKYFVKTTIWFLHYQQMRQSSEQLHSPSRWAIRIISREWDFISQVCIFQHKKMLNNTHAGTNFRIYSTAWQDMTTFDTQTQRHKVTTVCSRCTCAPRHNEYRS